MNRIRIASIVLVAAFSALMASGCTNNQHSKSASSPRTASIAPPLKSISSRLAGKTSIPVYLPSSLTHIAGKRYYFSWRSKNRGYLLDYYLIDINKQPPSNLDSIPVNGELAAGTLYHPLSNPQPEPGKNHMYDEMDSSNWDCYHLKWYGIAVNACKATQPTIAEAVTTLSGRTLIVVASQGGGNDSFALAKHYFGTAIQGSQLNRLPAGSTLRIDASAPSGGPLVSLWWKAGKTKYNFVTYNMSVKDVMPVLTSLIKVK